MPYYIVFSLLLCSFSLFGQSADSIHYSFFVAGHTYGKPGVNNIGFHPAFKQQFPYIQGRPEIKFGVLTGDIVSPNPIERDWDEIDADIDTLGLPVYFAVGNHDMENRPLFESRYGATYYSFKHQNDLFMVLDPNMDEWNILGEQMSFLQNTLYQHAATSDNIYVFFHQILWKDNDIFSYITWNSSAGRAAGDINFWTVVEPLFHKLPNTVVMFAGDLGAPWASTVTYDSYDNITLIASGMGGGEGDNFVVVNVKEDKSLSYDLICLNDSNKDCLGKLTDYLTVAEVQHTHLSPFIYVYPNPATDFFTIFLNDINNYRIQLYDQQGRLMAEEDIYNQYKCTVHTRGLSKGLYLARIIDPNGVKTIIKVLIE